MKRTFLLSLLLTSSPMFAAGPWFVRAGVGPERSSKVHAHDVDCTGANPPALFGCGAGSDNRSLGARGAFDDALAFELGAGMNVSANTRIELAVARRSLTLDADANFRGVAGAQPVRADAESRSAMLVGTIDFGAADSRVRPFASIGLGAARNELDRVRYAFPSLGAEAATITPSGTNTDPAWMLAGGASVRIAESLHLDFSLRYSELGEFRTDAGTATIVRPNRELTIAIDRTTMNAATGGMLVSLRYTVGGAGRS